MLSSVRSYIIFAVISGAFLVSSIALLIGRYTAAASLCAMAAAIILMAAGIYLRAAGNKAERRANDAEQALTAAERRMEAELERLSVRHKEEITQFRSLIAHELRIPSSVILGYAELLQSGIVTDEMTRGEYLDKICSRMRYMSKLLGQLFLESYTKLGIANGIFERLNIVELLDRVAGDVEHVARKNNISIRVQSSDEEIYVNGDYAQLTKMFYNILENSLKYMGHEGNISITVSMVEEDQVLLIFKDDGLGMDIEETAHIFELNYQGSNRKNGDGLGLHLVHMGVLAHGGTVDAKSRPGGGMSIFIYLSAAKAEREHDSERLAEAALPQS